MTERGRPRSATASGRPSTLVLACGALARELRELVDRNGLAGVVDVRYLPATLHNRPERIAPALDARLADLAAGYERIFVAYADCGSGGAVDRVVEAYGAERLPGAHCYAFYAGLEAFSEIASEEPGTFYLTDFLARSFEPLVINGLGIDRHPELLPVYFASYRRLVYLAQSDDPELLGMAKQAADRLGLAFEHRRTGYGELGTSIARLALSAAGELERHAPGGGPSADGSKEAVA